MELGVGKEIDIRRSTKGYRSNIYRDLTYDGSYNIELTAPKQYFAI